MSGKEIGFFDRLRMSGGRKAHVSGGKTWLFEVRGFYFWLASAPLPGFCVHFLSVGGKVFYRGGDVSRLVLYHSPGFFSRARRKKKPDSCTNGYSQDKPDTEPRPRVFIAHFPLCLFSQQSAFKCLATNSNYIISDIKRHG